MSDQFIDKIDRTEGRTCPSSVVCTTNISLAIVGYRLRLRTHPGGIVGGSVSQEACEGIHIEIAAKVIIVVEKPLEEVVYLRWASRLGIRSEKSVRAGLSETSKGGSGEERGKGRRDCHP